MQIICLAVKHRMTVSTTKKIYFTLGIISIITIWYLSSIIVNNSGIIPTVNEVLVTLGELLSELQTYDMILMTLLKIVISIIVSLLISILFACLSLINYKVESFIRPIISLFRTVPVVSIAMIVLIVFFDKDIRYIGTIVIATTVIIPIIYEGILTGFKTINSNIIDSTKLLSNINLTVLFNIHIPLAMPSIITSLIQSFGLGLKVLVMSEVIVNPPNSIGRLIGEYASYGELSYVFSWTIILVLIVVLFDVLLKKIKIKSWD